MNNIYDKRYDQDEYYWGLKPSSNCFRVLEIIPPDRPLKLLDVGCGEGRDAVFFASRGYTVTAFDISPIGIEKARQLAGKAEVSLDVFLADINEFRLTDTYDIIFSTGVLQYIPENLRPEVLGNYRQFTNPGGINALSVFVNKPFIARAPDEEQTSHSWISGELLTHYHDWRIEFTTEEIFDCMSSGVQHQHAISRVIARKEL
ncbi:MAG: methyltransferase domain-containing protein [Candidatus Aegiribacteria sp.]|nr:methyltransferase domain-containing protein [Candidatus Aegiribacteria sp.]